jgi:hypothetical protein
MATTKCISANAQKFSGNTATIVQGGAVPTTTEINSVTIRSLSNRKLENHVYQAVSANSSGNLGTIKAYPAGTFGYQADNTKFIMKVAGKYISGVATDIFLGGAKHINMRPFNKIQTTHTSFLTLATWSSNRDGQPTYTLTKSDQTPDFLADDACVDVGELTYRTGKPLPVQDSYQVKYSN